MAGMADRLRIDYATILSRRRHIRKLKPRSIESDLTAHPYMLGEYFRLAGDGNNYIHITS
jgi:hypothetical protein